jgi:hypothetical protein
MWDCFRWAVLHTVSLYYLTVITWRYVVSPDLPKVWVYDMPDWVCKYLQTFSPSDLPDEFVRIRRQAAVELDFRAAIGVSK